MSRSFDFTKLNKYRLFSRQAVRAAHERLAEARQQVQGRQAILADLEENYRVRQREERPTSRLALARKRLQAAERRCQSREPACRRQESLAVSATAARQDPNTVG